MPPLLSWPRRGGKQAAKAGGVCKPFFFISFPVAGIVILEHFWWAGTALRNGIQQFIPSMLLVCTCQKPSARTAQRTSSAASRKVTASGSNKINRSPVTAKVLCKQTGACAWLVPCPSQLRYFLHLYHQQSREKNKTGKVKREGEEHVHVQRPAATPEEECTSPEGLGGAAHVGRKEGAFGESVGTGQNTLKDGNDMVAEATLMLTGEWRAAPMLPFPLESCATQHLGFSKRLCCYS